MSGVYIKGIEMPTEGCVVSIYKINGKFYAGNDLCEVIPVPDHGRLIEAERLKEVFHRNVVSGDAFDQLIDIAPTIIPAEKEEEK